MIELNELEFEHTNKTDWFEHGSTFYHLFLRIELPKVIYLMDASCGRSTRGAEKLTKAREYIKILKFSTICWPLKLKEKYPNLVKLLITFIKVNAPTIFLIAK